MSEASVGYTGNQIGGLGPYGGGHLTPRPLSEEGRRRLRMDVVAEARRHHGLDGEASTEDILVSAKLIAAFVEEGK